MVMVEVLGVIADGLVVAQLADQKLSRATAKFTTSGNQFGMLPRAK
jgi:hypothetical protein